MRYIKSLLGAVPVRYLISSGVAFVADYLLLLFLDSLLTGSTFLSMELAAVISFAASSQINFWINRRWVFKSKKSPLPELGGYYSLALVSFSIKTFVLLELAVRFFRLPLFLAKPICEALMFAVNYVVQKKLIFRKKGAEEKTESEGAGDRDD